MVQCCYKDIETKEQCQNEASYRIIGYGHNIKYIRPLPRFDKKSVRTGEYPVCEECMAQMLDYVSLYHYKYVIKEIVIE